MAIPDYQSLMLPLLRLAGDGQEHSLRETIGSLAESYGLTDEERSQLLPSGGQTVFANRVSWACSYLKRAGLLMATRRGYYRITERGRQVLHENPSKVDVAFLLRFPEFVEFRNRSRPRPDETREADNDATQTPEEVIEAAYQALRQDLANELLQTIKERSPAFFERLVVDLLVRMGYGGTRQDAGEAIGRSGDGGIDGIIKEDRLGLDVIYVQAKRWENVVGRPEIQKFVGALQGQRARKGIFITTSTFSQEALDYAARVEIKIVLVDGQTLAQLMIDHNVGVTPLAVYELKRVDSDYFLEE
ncbi:MAG: restriction endonuclease [Anaerolineae bacterium]|nr:restriction endonuclease [Anaerolineae bacterium]